MGGGVVPRRDGQDVFQVNRLAAQPSPLQQHGAGPQGQGPGGLPQHPGGDGRAGGDIQPLLRQRDGLTVQLLFVLPQAAGGGGDVGGGLGIQLLQQREKLVAHLVSGIG